MKRKLLVILLAIVCIGCLTFGLTACKNRGDKQELKPTEGLVFTLNEDEASYSVIGIGTANDTDIVIPAIYDNFPVTEIGKGAFMMCESLESIVIPDSVTSIGFGAFSHCLELTSVTIGNSVTSIESGAFSECRGLTNIVIPDSVTEIGKNAFYYCDEMNVTFDNPDGWWVSTTSTATSGTSISSDDLADSEIAAEYLIWTYTDYYWKRG